MNKIIHASLLMLLPVTVVAGEWHAIGGVIVNETVLEDKLWGYIIDNHQISLKSRESYTYQYINKGNGIIYINSFCDDWGRTNLDTELLIVKDGGACYFQVHYDKKTEMFFGLSVNGAA